MFNRKTTFLSALVETALSVIAGFAILILPITLLWLIEPQPDVDWFMAFRTAADIWLLAHGVKIVVLAGTVAGVEVTTFGFSLIPLAFSVLMLSSAYRMGRRLAATSSLWPGWVASGIVYAVAAFSLTAAAHTKQVFPVEWRGTFFPVALYLLVLIASSLFSRPSDALGTQFVEAQERVIVRDWLNQQFEKLYWVIRVVAVPALRAGTAVVFMLVGVSALIIGLSLAFNWIGVIRLYESMQLSIFGAILVTLVQLAYLPNLVILGATWFTGVGFSIGTGSLVSPLGSQLGPVPSIPVFAALPVGALGLGMIAIAIPIIAAMVATINVRKYTDELRFEFANTLNAALSLGIAIGLVAAIEIAFLALLASGSIGPERMQDFGANPWMVAAVLFVEVAGPAVLVSFLTARTEQPDAAIVERHTKVN